MPVFTHGVASGDVTATSAILWTRIDRDTNETDGVSFSEIGTFRTAPSPYVAADLRSTYTGDTIYSDSSFRAGGPATTLAQYHATHRESRGYTNLRALLGSTSVYAMMDDHEVVNDYDAETVDLARYAAGRRAFLD